MSWKDIVAKIAPTIGTAIGGPLGGMAVNLVCDAIGIKHDSPDAAIETALLASPENLLKLKQAELDFQAKMKELDIDIAKIDADDRNSARQREIAIHDYTPKTIAILVIVGYIGVQYFILTHIIDTGMRDIILRSLGTIDMALGMVLTYYFGSSNSSREKDKTITNMSK